jgi:betaine-aldehyde dehydrogenase
MTVQQLFNWVDGQWVTTHTNRWIDVLSPTDGSPIAQVGDSDAADVDHAVTAARRAFDSGIWSDKTVADRAQTLRAMADEVERRVPELSEAMVADVGCTARVATAMQAFTPALHLRAFADMEDVLSPVHHVVQGPVAPGSWTVSREPIGVVAAYIPYNFPLFEAVWKVAPALLAGNTVVVKPSPLTPLAVQVLAEVADAVGLPAGVINIVHGDADAGSALAAHPGVDFITFTGSSTVAGKIASAAALNLTPVMAELGGKSASVILPDADLTLAIRGSLFSGFMNNGQTCVSTTRILLPADLYDEGVAIATELAEKLVVGDPADPATDIGPLISARQRDDVASHVERAVQQGAKVTVGGEIPSKVNADGFYYSPTILRDVTPDMDIAGHEVFGPVLSFISYATIDDAVRIANDTEYGLASAVWGRDVPQAVTVSNRLLAGLKWINDVGQIEVALTPMAGRKCSGMGSELGSDGLLAYTLPASTYTSGGDGSQGVVYNLVGSHWDQD